MKSTYLLNFVLIFLFACSWSSPKSKEIDQSPNIPTWLEGTWQASRDTSLLEQWTVQSDSIITGQGFHVSSEDTTFFEFLEIRQFPDSLCYIATVPGQNEGKSIYFRMIEIDSLGFTCQNPKHDFPKKLVYKLAGTDSMLVSISGIENSEDRKMEFSMVRKKDY
ncbi:MAG: DUF6265 family protein [Bacteroidales bacterium]|nr:DUF6265 family protein [Bacteroidales bacterium]MCF8456057.1 DUF6265 family protein [Bacteroidales bacterium]